MPKKLKGDSTSRVTDPEKSCKKTEKYILDLLNRKSLGTFRNCGVLDYQVNSNFICGEFVKGPWASQK